jgi:predicted O-methyltransferase YrrM
MTTKAGDRHQAREAACEKWADELFAPLRGVEKSLREKADHEGFPPIALNNAEGKLLSILIESHGCQNFVEVGTLYGFSAHWICKALPAHGKLYSLEQNPNYASFAKKELKALHEDKIEILEGDARKSLELLSEKGPFDGIFIDADKSSYPAYLDWAEKNLRKNALIIADNTYFFGKVQKDPSEIEAKQRKGQQGVRLLNERLADESRFRSILIPTGEGMTMAIKLF